MGAKARASILEHFTIPHVTRIVTDRLKAIMIQQNISGSANVTLPKSVWMESSKDVKPTSSPTSSSPSPSALATEGTPTTPTKPIPAITTMSPGSNRKPANDNAKIVVGSDNDV